MCDNNIIIHHFFLTRYQQRESDEDDVVATKILRNQRGINFKNYITIERVLSFIHNNLTLSFCRNKKIVYSTSSYPVF